MVTTRSSASYTGPALASFFRHTTLGPEDRFLLIDNDGAENTISAPYASKIETIVNPSPRSFAANANQAVSIALDSGSDLYFLNNDLIFSENWISPLESETESILSPLSPREVQYACSVVNTKSKISVSTTVLTNPSNLEDYLRCPCAFDYIAEAHRLNTEGYWSLFVVPFFAVKIPLLVLQKVGQFDEKFGLGGAEDYDYCLRAVLAGFQVKFALKSYLLHFAGKSSWAGPEDSERRKSRESVFMKVFEDKWGSALFDMIFHENEKVLSGDPELHALQQQGKLREIVQRLLGTRTVAINL